MIIPFPTPHTRTQVRLQARSAAASMSAQEQRVALEQLQQQLHAAGPDGLTPELQAALKRLDCASEHEALLKMLGLLLDRRAQAPAAGRSSGEIAGSSLY